MFSKHPRRAENGGLPLAIGLLYKSNSVCKEDTHLWNKRNEEGPAQAVASRPVPPEPEHAPVQTPASAPPPVRHEAPPASRHTATIGPAMHINGEIRTDEELLVDGEVEGSIVSHHLVTVGANGRVRANITAREVAIFGAVQGNIEVTEKIAIRDQGSLVGDIKTSGISIDDGAYFKGSIDITRPQPKVSAKPVKSEVQGRTETSAAI
jgi:cytoskeletal protein CcmA (bactofilin family)